MKPIKSVYSYYFPETRQIVDEIVKNYPHKTFLKSTDPGFPLDIFEKPVIEKYVKWISKQLPNLNQYKYQYVTNGSSEAIFHILAKIKAEEPDTPIYCIEGEYEGYKEYAKTLGLNIFEIPLDNLAFRPKVVEQLDRVYDTHFPLAEGIWFISNPSAIHGNILPNRLAEMFANRGHRVIFDASYVGMTKPFKFDEINNPNILAVLTSFSKPFGLFYYRIGFTFSRFPIQSLVANKWFKNILSIMIVEKILDTYKSDYFYKKYDPIRNKILEKIRRQENGMKLNPSDVFLLAHLRIPDYECYNVEEIYEPKELKKFIRGKYYRFCLTPYFLEEEKNET